LGTVSGIAWGVDVPPPSPPPHPHNTTVVAAMTLRPTYLRHQRAMFMFLLLIGRAQH
jgi:hypothetical protein